MNNEIKTTELRVDNNKVYYEHNKYYIQNGGVYVAFNTIGEVREYLANRLKNI